MFVKEAKDHLNTLKLTVIKQHVVDPVNHVAFRQNPAMASEPVDGPWYDRQWTAMASSRGVFVAFDGSISINLKTCQFLIRGG